MKKNPYLWTLLLVLFFSLPALVLAAPNLAGTWKGSAKKITNATCNVPTPMTLIISQCKVAGKPGNLFSGTLKLGTESIKIVGRIEPDNTVRANGSEISVATASVTTAFILGKFIPATSKLQINELQLTSSKTPNAILNEMYDIITLSK